MASTPSEICIHMPDGIKYPIKITIYKPDGTTHINGKSIYKPDVSHIQWKLHYKPHGIKHRIEIHFTNLIA